MQGLEQILLILINFLSLYYTKMDTVTAILLLISLSAIGYLYYTLYQKKTEKVKSTKWPPFVNKCPDYWFSNKQNMCIPQYVSDETRSECKKPKNFNTEYYQGDNGDVNKCNWVKKCGGISWEGIDNLCA